MNKWIIIDTDINQVIDTVFNQSKFSVDVIDAERMNYEGVEIHAILDNDATRSLSELEKERPDYIVNVEYLYRAAIKSGFLNPNTLETYEDVI